jgi:hypothetical protein
MVSFRYVIVNALHKGDNKGDDDDDDDDDDDNNNNNNNNINNNNNNNNSVVRDGVVGIATRYELDGTGIESRCGRDFRTCPDFPWGPPSLL